MANTSDDQQQQQQSQSRPQSKEGITGTGNDQPETGGNEEQQTTPCPLCQEPYSEYSELENHVMQIHSVNSDGLQRLLVLMEGKKSYLLSKFHQFFIICMSFLQLFDKKYQSI